MDLPMLVREVVVEAAANATVGAEVREALSHKQQVGSSSPTG